MTLCECGCGQETNIGRRFVRGHNTRIIFNNGYQLCRCCGDLLNDDNWASWRKSSNDYICNTCNHKNRKEYYKNNQERMREKANSRNHTNGVLPMNKNRYCSAFLGVYIAEQVLSRVFNDVETMPYATPDYDFICNRNKKIDVKAACARIRKNRTPSWGFSTKKNLIADFFLCIAFDDRNDLVPLYLWMIPTEHFKNIGYASISQTTLHKWDEYRLDIDDVIFCCDHMREK